MAAKEKDKEEKKKKPVIKVEEIEESETEDKKSVKEAPEKEESDIKTKEETPAVSSFSQLDTSAPPSPAGEKSKENESETKEDKVKSDTDEKKEETTDTEKAASEKEQISSDEVKEWLKDVRPDTTKDNEKGRGPGGKFIILTVILLALLGAVVGGVMYFQQGVNLPNEEEVAPTQEPAKETPAPTQEPQEEEVDLAAISINVLNGSGIAGEAGKVKDLLVAGDFSEDNIETGNADSYDYEGLTVKVKEDTPNTVYDAFDNLLSNDYEVSLSEENLDKDYEYDIEIVVGQ